ncbi:hypothetical protein Tco_0106560, partial [Tanacetum coccineum]
VHVGTRRADDTAQTVIVMFDETTTALVGCSAGSLMDIEDEGGKDSVGSSTLDVVADVQTLKLKRLVRAPSVATPSKPSEPRKRKRLIIEYFDAEASDDLSGCVGENKADPLSDNKRMKRVLIDDSTGDISCGTPEDGNTDRADGRSNKKKGRAYVDASSE